DLAARRDPRSRPRIGMKAGIIAAGLGERFRRAGITTPKPLVAVAGKTLLERAIEAAADAGATEIAVLVNGEWPDVARYVGALAPPAAGSGCVTGGAYFSRPAVYRHVSEARRRKLAALREFLALLLESGERLRGFPAGDSIDVDRPEDVPIAERFLERDG